MLYFYCTFFSWQFLHFGTMTRSSCNITEPREEYYQLSLITQNIFNRYIDLLERKASVLPVSVYLGNSGKILMMH